MSFTSFSFIVFILIAVALWNLLPKRFHTGILFGINLIFYGFYSLSMAVFLLAFQVIIYFSGLIISRHRTKTVTGAAVLISLSPLLFFKYVPIKSLLVPLGISYFTFKSIGYLVDVYKEKIPAEKNFIILGAFISFFPELLTGPIDRTDNLLRQLQNDPVKNGGWDNFLKGLIILFGGYFEKLVVADRLGIIVDSVYSDLPSFKGFTVLIAVCCYSLQLYFDFAGCTYMAQGVGKMLGYDLPVNFRQPYFALSVEDFWRRWHISLTSWLRDYIYIPLGGNRKGTFRKFLNIIIVFLISGIWHGTGLTFVIWGGLNGVFQIIGTLLKDVKNKIYQMAGMKTDSVLFRLWKRLGVFALMSIAFVFFRSSSLQEAALVFKSIFESFNPWILFDGSLYTLGLSERNVFLLILFLLIMLAVDFAHEKSVIISDYVLQRHGIAKGVILYILIFLVLIFGIYGSGYDVNDFIYMQF